MRVTVTTPLHATEDPDKVLEAATAWFDGEVTVDGDRLVVDGRGPKLLDAFRDRVWELQIIDTVRARILPGVATDGRSLRFTLHKQAALTGKVSFPVTPHPLGDLKVAVFLEDGDAWKDAETLAWWLCPATEEGHIIGGTTPETAGPVELDQD